MCGIAGVFGRPDRDAVARMLATLVHRGPDDEHLVDGEDFALGARRLAIVDVEGGRQPLTTDGGRVWAAHNGEIYNFPGIREALAARGRRFRTRCDTEVIPHLYEEHGSAFAEVLDGMFAVAVWDADRRRGVLARDRVGKKPLYYTLIGGTLLFASEIKALLAVPGVSRRLSLPALHHFLSLKHVPHPLTIFDGIRALPPAHRLVFTPEQAPVVERYWSPDFSPDPALASAHDDELAGEILRLLGAAVARRLMSDVPIGFFLSGGIDSSLVTALAAEASGSRIRTFSLTYTAEATTPGKEADRRWARRVAERWGTDHHEEALPTERFSDTLPCVLACFDEPFAGVTSTWHLSRLMARHVKVALAGDGADELFGSYLSHRLALPLANLQAWRETAEPSLIRPFDHEPERLAALEAPTDWQWRCRLHVFSEADKQTLLTPEARRALGDASTEALTAREYAELTAKDPLNRVLEAEFRHQLPDQVLTFVDRLSMAHSLEIRAPFLDTALCSFVARIPGERKMPGGRTKHLLKLAATRLLPAELVERPKEGFVMPVAGWLRGPLRQWAAATLSAPRLAPLGVFEPDAVTSLLARALDGPEDLRRLNQVLALLVVVTWFERYRPTGVG
jgi:asparagine synthase (glutamine-hydrolysing)